MSLSRPLIIAHRGASRHASENTLAAFRLAWEQGADAIETDLRLTADGEIVAFHDADGRRIFGNHRLIRNLARAELPATVPTLAEVLAQLPADRQLVLEFKEPLGAALPAALVGAPVDRITLIAFDAAVISAAKREIPGCRALWLYGGKMRFCAGRARGLADRVRELGVDGIDLAYGRHLCRRLLDPLREEGRTIFTYTLNAPAKVRDAQLLGVDGITTDRPGAAREWLNLPRGEA